MNTDKDYYAVLGVQSSVDPAALAAAYRMLLKRFHPDVYAGPKALAEQVTKEINEAYGVLSDPKSRRAYDEDRVLQSGPFDRTDDAEQGLPLEQAWRAVVAWQPEAEEHRAQLLLLSPELAASYQRRLVAAAGGGLSPSDLAARLKADFLARHFSRNRVVQDFVLDALNEGRRDVAQEVSHTVKRFGPPVYTRNFLWRVSRMTGWTSPRFPGYRPRPRRATLILVLLIAVAILALITVNHRH